MAAGQPDKKERKEKKDKKRSDEGGIKKDKKDRKEKKDKKAKLAAALDDHLQTNTPAATATDVLMSTDLTGEAAAPAVIAPATLVPFAIPLADEKNMKKVLKTVRKAAKNNALKRGVKEVVKALRKSPASSPTNRAFIGVVVIAGDISPQDVISHLPVLCEDHNVPYIFVPSRAELGAAAKTKRPTSVVMIMEKPEAKKAAAKGKDKEKKEDKGGEDDGEKYPDTYQSLVKLVQKETEKQAFW